MRKSNLLILAIMFCYGFIVSSCETVEDNPTDNPQPVDTEFDHIDNLLKMITVLSAPFGPKRFYYILRR